MTFKEQVIAKLSPKDSFIRIFSVDEDKSVVETSRNGLLVRNTLNKVDISSLFSSIPYVEVTPSSTYDDVYKTISDRYGLGWVRGVDYYNSDQIQFPETHPRWERIPLKKDSYGYYGILSVMLVAKGKSLTGEILERDLTELDQNVIYDKIKLRTFFTSKVFDLEDPKKNVFADNKLSINFVDLLIDEMQNEFDEVLIDITRTGLIRGCVVGLINDGLSDVMLFQVPSGVEIFIRFYSERGDLPNLKLFPNGNDDVLVDDSNGSTTGGDGKVSEKPDEGKGDSNNSDYEVINPNPSLPPKENNTDLDIDHSETMIQ